MAKQKNKPLPRKTLCVVLEIIVEDEVCIAAWIQNPHLTNTEIYSLGNLLVRYATLLWDHDEIDEKLGASAAKIRLLRHGDTP